MSEAPKKAPPPPPPSRSDRKNLNKAEVEENSAPSGEAEGETAVVPEESHVEDVVEDPLDIINGEPLVHQLVAPDRYKWFRAVVEGTEDDIVEFKVGRIVHQGAVTVRVNAPPNETFPTKESYDWDPTRGHLVGCGGTYYFSVQGVPSFIEKDEQWLTSADSNWSEFDLFVEWKVLDEASRKKVKEIQAKYSLKNTHSVWSENYSKEIEGKYIKQQEEWEQELKEKMEKFSASSKTEEISLDNHAITKTYDVSSQSLGKGDFTDIRAAKEKSTGKEVAIKIINKKEAADTGFSEAVIKHQIQVLKSIQHENIVGFKEAVDGDQALCIVLEKLGGLTLFQKLNLLTADYGEDEARDIAKQLLQGVAALHAQDWVHRAIQPHNIMFNDNKQLKLVGFTISANAKDAEKEPAITGGDASFVAPEALNQQPVGKPADIWAVGVMIYIILSGKKPFKNANTIKLYSTIRQGTYDLTSEEWTPVSNEAKDLIKALLTVDAAKRPTAAQALEHAWFKASSNAKLPSVKKNIATY